MVYIGINKHIFICYLVMVFLVGSCKQDIASSDIGSNSSPSETENQLITFSVHDACFTRYKSCREDSCLYGMLCNCSWYLEDIPPEVGLNWGYCNHVGKKITITSIMAEFLDKSGKSIKSQKFDTGSIIIEAGEVCGGPAEIDCSPPSDGRYAYQSSDIDLSAVRLRYTFFYEDEKGVKHKESIDKEMKIITVDQ